MTPELDRLLRELEPPSGANEPARLAFGLACIERVAHLLEEPAALSCLAAFRQGVRAGAGADVLSALAAQAEDVANRHPGSRSLDGVGHAAVSATYATARAIAGRARQAAEYAAYAAVYGQGGYGATSDVESFVPEYEWQAKALGEILARTQVHGAA
jgi:hypothetical protein